MSKVCVVTLKWSNEKDMRDYSKIIGVFDESMFWKAEEIQREFWSGVSVDEFFPDGDDYITDIDVELENFEVQSERRKSMRENKQEILDKFVECLQLTNNAGFSEGNPLVKLEYIDNGHDQIVRPIFEDGSGKNGYYDVCVTWDSGTAMLVDVCNQFVRKMW